MVKNKISFNDLNGFLKVFVILFLMDVVWTVLVLLAGLILLLIGGL